MASKDDGLVIKFLLGLGGGAKNDKRGGRPVAQRRGSPRRRRSRPTSLFFPDAAYLSFSTLQLLPCCRPISTPQAVSGTSNNSLLETKHIECVIRSCLLASDLFIYFFFRLGGLGMQTFHCVKWGKHGWTEAILIDF